MTALVIDTSTHAVAIAVGTSSVDSVSSVIDRKSSHSENIIKSMHDCLAQYEAQLKNIETIGVAIGPGLFTGLRVGITCAHALAHALDTQLVYFSALELMSKSNEIEAGQSSQLIVGRDARRQEMYFAKYGDEIPVHQIEIDNVRFASSIERISQESLITPADLINQIEPSDSVVLDSFETYVELSQLKESDSARDSNSIMPERVLDMVIQASKNGIVANVNEPQALYLRQSDAELSWNKS